MREKRRTSADVGPRPKEIEVFRHAKTEKKSREDSTTAYKGPVKQRGETRELSGHVRCWTLSVAEWQMHPTHFRHACRGAAVSVAYLLSWSSGQRNRKQGCRLILEEVADCLRWRAGSVTHPLAPISAASGALAGAAVHYLTPAVHPANSSRLRAG